MKSTKKIILIPLFLTLFLFVAAFLYYGSIIIWPPRPHPILPTGWYIPSPDGYFYLKDPQENKTVQWLQGMPYPKSYMDRLIESPYTFEEWLKEGSKINDLEETLLRLYNSKYRCLLDDSLIRALKEHGTQMTVDFMKQELIRNCLSHEEKPNLYDMIYGILNDQEDFSRLMIEIENHKQVCTQTIDPNGLIFN